jgi:3-oxoacyl-[acyl-carrier protein] reductase
MAFRKRTAIVTGASRGIGRAISLELARSGCNIAFTYAHSSIEAEQLTQELSALGVGVYAFQTPVGDFSAAEHMARKVISRFDAVDYLINNAGIIKDKLLLRMNESDWDDVIETNLKGAFNYSKAVSALMIKARFGSILNISSVSGIIGATGQTNYSASKAGMIGLTKSLAKELASRNITVNALALGLIDTDMTKSMSADYRDAALKNIPLRRFGTVQEVATIAAFLLSEEARYITGQVIQIDGGLAI